MNLLIWSLKWAGTNVDEYCVIGIVNSNLEFWDLLYERWKEKKFRNLHLLTKNMSESEDQNIWRMKCSVTFEWVWEWLLLDEIPFSLPKSRETKDAGVFNGFHLGVGIPSYTSSFFFFIPSKMRSDLFDHIMVWIYNSEISCQMDIRMNIPYTALRLCITWSTHCLDW